MKAAKTIVVVGYGPGNGDAVAEKFGKEGFSVALVGRNEEHLAAGVSALKDRGVTAAAFPGDAADPAAIAAAVRNVRAKLGPITVVHWNASGAAEAGDLLTADPTALRGVFDTAVFGLLAAVREALPHLKSAGDGAILITNGGFGDVSADMDRYVASARVMGMALANAAKNKLAGLLAARLESEGVYVGEVTIYGIVKRTPADNGTVDPSTVAAKFWDLYRSRSELRARIG